MKKRIAILLIALCLVLLFSSCQKSKDQTREENQAKIDAAQEAAASGADFWASVEEDIQPLDENCVYWTPNGASYHATEDCVALMRSKQIESGTLKEAFLAGKVDPCSKCVGD